MARRSFAIPLTALIAGAIGLAAGIYLAPTDETDEFRNLLRNSTDAKTETSIPVSPSTEAPQAKDSEEAKRPPEAAEPISPTGSRNNPPAEMVGAEPKPTTTSKPTAPVTPEAVGEPKPAAAASVKSCKTWSKKAEAQCRPEDPPRQKP